MYTIYHYHIQIIIGEKNKHRKQNVDEIPNHVLKKQFE